MNGDLSYSRRPIDCNCCFSSQKVRPRGRRHSNLNPSHTCQSYIDYSRIAWNAGALTRLISALRYPNRVLKITLNGSPKNDFDKICKALDLPFPALQSFELHDLQGNVEHILLATSFMTSIKSLRHLRLANVRLSPLLPLLSVTKALVFLELTVDTLFWPTGRASLLTHLQCIPHLRAIQISTQSTLSNYMPKPPMSTALLAELSYPQLFRPMY